MSAEQQFTQQMYDLIMHTCCRCAKRDSVSDISLGFCPALRDPEYVRDYAYHPVADGPEILGLHFYPGGP